MKKTVKLLSVMMAVCMLLSSCAQGVGEVANVINDGISENNALNNVVSDTNTNDDAKVEQLSTSTRSDAVPEKGTYNEGVALVKYDGEMNDNVLSQLDLVSATALYSGSTWYTVELKADADTVETVTYLRELGVFEKVDYDYIMGTTADASTADVSNNPDYEKHKHHHTHKIPEGWEEVKKNGKHPGGSSDVIVAVIDTGVDYNHLDLRNNIWINTAEIADNGKDDDGNGYIDDVYGWDCVGNDNDPMDDNGHGTHVAGIIAAENNNIGGVGIAYNCKVMCIKAGNSSGYFNNSDIAEAIQYAYMNGASVINMSFGGSFISIAVEEALENAYNTCVLVAAAGNDGACNNLACKTCDVVKVSYPAALPYVIGVMSTNHDGSAVSSFSNYDHNPYNSIEYEVYAVGEAVPSCWPGNQYAELNGTSMAAPTVSAIAALLRSAYPDRNTYSTKYLQSQIVNTGTINPYNYLTKDTDGYHSVANVYEALTQIPKPYVNLYDYSIDDSTSISSNNNGNGVIDAGETVRLYISLHNRGGVASNVNVSIDTNRGMDLVDPYFTFVNPTMKLSDIGTYSVRESGDQYFEIVVDANCPNDYLVNFNIRFTYTNGLDTEDKTVYEDDGRQQAQFNVSSGYHLPSIIAEDTVFTNDRLYIVGENVMITAGVTVTFEEGCRIQFYDDREYYSSPAISVYGTLIFEGSKENMIEIYPSERDAVFACQVNVYSSGSLTMNYVDAINLYTTGTGVLRNSYINYNGSGKVDRTLVYDAGKAKYDSSLELNFSSVENSYLNLNAYASEISSTTMNSNYIVMLAANYPKLTTTTFTNNILYSEHSPEIYQNYAITFKGTTTNNFFVSADDKNPQDLLELVFEKKSMASNNAFSAGYQEYANQVISNYLDENGQPTVDVFGSCSDVSALYPHIVSVEIFNKDGEQITTIGKEEITVRVTFNKAMDTTKDVSAFFGTIAPYADYKVEGAFVSETEWVGTYSLKAYIENGLQFMQVKGACAADDATKTVHGENQLYVFNIDTTAAMAMNLFANATDAGIELTWVQDDYATLMGYNIYRSTSKDGNYVKINPTVLLPETASFVDDNAEPGVTYWYTFTVVLSDFSESAPAGKVYCTAVDTLAPSVYHTPVNQGYAGNNLVISCTASDNMKLANVTLYYRTVGADEWKTLNMSKQSDKYSATIFGSDVTLAGIEYYIVASDGRNTIAKGSADAPYTVLVKDASSISRKGDVDGDGVVTTKDALMLMQSINEERLLTDDEFRRADLNGDGVLNSMEALRILQYINGNVNTLEM
ncbi:MAG: S8 family serine peptidase [Clostridia bacterium]|nr:S8 family serine peptidase [Clostridia bacterium]